MILDTDFCERQSRIRRPRVLKVDDSTDLL